MWLLEQGPINHQPVFLNVRSVNSTAANANAYYFLSHAWDRSQCHFDVIFMHTRFISVWATGLVHLVSVISEIHGLLNTSPKKHGRKWHISYRSTTYVSFHIGSHMNSRYLVTVFYSYPPKMEEGKHTNWFCTLDCPQIETRAQAEAICMIAWIFVLLNYHITSESASGECMNQGLGWDPKDECKGRDANFSKFLFLLQFPKLCPPVACSVSWLSSAILGRCRQAPMGWRQAGQPQFTVPLSFRVPTLY